MKNNKHNQLNRKQLEVQSGKFANSDNQTPHLSEELANEIGGRSPTQSGYQGLSNIV